MTKTGVQGQIRDTDGKLKITEDTYLSEFYTENDDTRYSARDNIDELADKQYNNKKSYYNDYETQFLMWSNGSVPVGEVKKFNRYGKIKYYEKTKTGCIELSKKQYSERVKHYAEDTYRRAERKIGRTVNNDAGGQRNQSGNTDGDRNERGMSALSGQARSEELQDDIRGSVSGGSGNDNESEISYSYKSTADSKQALEKALKKNKALSEANRLLKTQLRLTNGKMITRENADKIAKQLVNYYGVKRNDVSKLSESIYNAFYDNFTTSYSNGNFEKRLYNTCNSILYGINY